VEAATTEAWWTTIAQPPAAPDEHVDGGGRAARRLGEDVLVDRDPRRVARQLGARLGEDELQALLALEEGEERRRDPRPPPERRPPGMGAHHPVECSQRSDMASRSRDSKAS
jgi:hypothetical protein